MADIFYIFTLKKDDDKGFSYFEDFLYKYRIKKTKGAYIDRSINGIELLFDLIEEMMEGGYE